MPQLQPRAVRAWIQTCPAHLDIAEDAFGMRHHGGETAVLGGDSG